MLNSDQVAVYEHRAWTGYILPMILPGAHRITASLGERSADVLSRIQTSCRTFVFHINLTFTGRVPLERDELINAMNKRDIKVLNGQTLDISKRAIQEICVRAGFASVTARLDGDPDELMMVKTTYNYHGVSEANLPVQQLHILGYESPDDIPRRRDAGYQIMRRSEVPMSVWNSPHWVVERYVTNKAHKFFRVYLARDSMIVSRVFDPSIFKKMPIGIDRESYYMNLSEADSLPDAPPDIEGVASLSACIARAAQIDFGAFDVVADDHDHFYLIDINTTPSWSDGGHPDLLAYLGAGLP